MGERSFRYDPKNYTVAAKGANRPSIDPKKKVNKTRNIAHYPASTLPPPDFMGPFPTDRKVGLKLAEEAETVEEALARRGAGGAIPDSYIPSYKTRDSS